LEGKREAKKKKDQFGIKCTEEKKKDKMRRVD
jgi:hypothetical protein